MRILKEDEIKSPYDLREMLWYIIPGATLLLLIFFFEFWFATQIRGVHPNSIYEKDKLDSIQTLFISSDSTQKIILARERDSLSIRHQMYENLFDSLHTPIFSALSITHTPLFENVKGEKTLIDNWVLAALYFLLLLTISYIIGHLTYIFGTFIYERGLISKGFSYPYLKLLGLEEGAQKDNPSQRSMEEIIASQSFYRGMYFWSAFIFIFSYILFLYWVKYWGISYLEYYRYLILLITLLLIFFPIRLKFILSKITDWSKEKRINREIKPSVKGKLYWFICIILLWFIFSIFYGWHSTEVLISLSMMSLVIILTETIVRKKSQNCNCIDKIQ